MDNLKIETAKRGLSLIKPYEIIGLGAGSNVKALIELISAEKTLKSTLKFVVCFPIIFYRDKFSDVQCFCSDWSRI